MHEQDGASTKKKDRTTDYILAKKMKPITVHPMSVKEGGSKSAQGSGKSREAPREPKKVWPDELLANRRRHSKV